VKGYAILILGAADGSDTPFDLQYVVEYQPEFWAGSSAVDQHFLKTSPREDDARIFPKLEGAFEYWRQTQPAPHDVRDDGKPNRPLTGFHVTMIKING
jgi:hypothetical protein